jgi:hypothetical protein
MAGFLFFCFKFQEQPPQFLFLVGLWLIGLGPSPAPLFFALALF